MLCAVAFILSQSCIFKSAFISSFLLSFRPSFIHSFTHSFINSLIYSLFFSFLTSFPFLIYDILFISNNAFEMITYINFRARYIRGRVSSKHVTRGGRIARPAKGTPLIKVPIKCAPPQCCPSCSAGSAIKRTTARLTTDCPLFLRLARQLTDFTL
jgi:hypothetical protein